MNYAKYYEVASVIYNYTAGREFIYVANPGNLGDAAIRLGTLKFFANFGLRYKEVTRSKLSYLIQRLTHDTIVIGGGGAFCHHYDRSSLVLGAAKLFKHVIVLPSTYGKKYHFPSNVTAFRRDESYSKEYCPSSLFCHDMAFNIGHINCSSGTGEGYFFRTDLESCGNHHSTANNNDISALGDEYDSLGLFINKIGSVQTVHTDRLHVAIIAGLCDKQVLFHEGNWFKNQGVFDASIKEFFPKTTLITKH